MFLQCTILDALTARGAHLNTPAFLNGRSQLTPSEVLVSRRIASVRIHVERAIHRIKNYRILHNMILLSYAHLADLMFTICAYLVNFQRQLFPQ